MADITPCAAGTGGEHVGFVLCKQPPCGGNTTNSPWISVYSQSPSYKAVISHPCLALEQHYAPIYNMFEIAFIVCTQKVEEGGRLRRR